MPMLHARLPHTDRSTLAPIQSRDHSPWDPSFLHPFPTVLAGALCWAPLFGLCRFSAYAGRTPHASNQRMSSQAHAVVRLRGHHAAYAQSRCAGSIRNQAAEKAATIEASPERVKKRLRREPSRFARATPLPRSTR